MPHHKYQRAALRHVLLRQKRLRKLLPVAGDLLHVDVFGALVFGLDGEGLAVFEVQTGDVVSLSGNTGRVRPNAPGGYHGHYEVIQTNAPFGSEEFYKFNHKHKPTDLRILLRGM